MLNLDKDNTALLKAFLPFFIIAHHYFRDIPDMVAVGKYVVTLFFFISGYGLEYQRLQGRVFDISNLIKRLKNLFTPTIVPIAIYLSCRYFIEGASIQSIVAKFAEYKLILPYTWFILTLIQLYIIYYVSSCLTNKLLKETPCILFILSTLYIGILYVFNIQSTYYCSVYGFTAGSMLIHILPFLNKYRRYTWLAVIGLLFSLLISKASLPFEMFYNSWIYVFTTAILISAIVFKNRIIPFFSELSYELYLCQGISFLLYNHLNINNINGGGIFCNTTTDNNICSVYGS